MITKLVERDRVHPCKEPIFESGSRQVRKDEANYRIEALWPGAKPSEYTSIGHIYEKWTLEKDKLDEAEKAMKQVMKDTNIKALRICHFGQISCRYPVQNPQKAIEVAEALKAAGFVNVCVLEERLTNSARYV
jgi:predicted negative regulator of RcsB-dependent stress response